MSEILFYKIGECDFEELDNTTWNIIHTEVDNSYIGQKIARKLVENIIEKANANKKNLVADCSYAKKIINK